MGYGIRSAAGTNGIKTFEPDDTEDCFYLHTGAHYTLGEILDKAADKWNLDCRGGDALGAALGMIEITSEHIQTDCLGYDLHDDCDYTDFLKITLLK